MADSVFTLFNGFLRFFTAAFSELLIRYLLFAGLAFLVFYVFLRCHLHARKVQPAFPHRKDYLREIGYSVLSAAIFALVGWLGFASFTRPFTQWYFRLDAHSGWYFAFSVVAMIVVHDAYFYWTHRLMHWSPLYRLMHRVHHRSTNPSPWAAYSFHPLEAVVEASIVLVIAVAIPAHPLALAIFLVWMTAFNVSGHLGYELYPRWLTGSRWGRWLNTSKNHNQHHQYFRENYALYFRWWDVWMGTTHSRYESDLEALQGRAYIDPALRSSREGMRRR